MGSDWLIASLKEISIDVSYGYTESASNEKVGPHFLRITDIQNGVVDWSSVPYCYVTQENHEKYRLANGDIVVARTGNSTGENFLFQGNKDAVFASYLIRFRIDREKADPRFVWYNLRSCNWWNFIGNSKTGSAQAGANAKILGNFPINLPSLSEQRAIAHILGTLDDKIELNRKMNETLEAMAQALFKSWFVDFEPWSGEKPANWREGTLGECVTIKRGGSPRPIQEYLSNTGLRWLKISDVTSLQTPFVLKIKEHIKESGLRKTVFLKSGSLVLSNSATPGIPKILCADTCIHDGWLYFPVSLFSNEYLYLFFKHIRQDLVALGNGSIFTNLKTDILKNYIISIPDAQTLQNFDKLIIALFEAIKNRVRESATLVELRDLLLPKLVSGQLRVKDAEKILGNIA